MSEEFIARIQVWWLQFCRYLHHHFMVSTYVRQAEKKDIFKNLSERDRVLLQNLRENKICTRCGELFCLVGPYLRRQRLCSGCVLNCSVFGNQLKHKRVSQHKCELKINLGCCVGGQNTTF